MENLYLISSQLEIPIISLVHWRRLREAGGRRPLGSDTQVGEICLTLKIFWQVMPTWYSKILV